MLKIKIKIKNSPPGVYTKSTNNDQTPKYQSRTYEKRAFLFGQQEVPAQLQISSEPLVHKSVWAAG